MSGVDRTVPGRYERVRERGGEQRGENRGDSGILALGTPPCLEVCTDPAQVPDFV